MRTIKFKAWDKVTEKMYQVQEMELQDTCRHVIIEGLKMEKYWALCSFAEDWNVADDIEDCIVQAKESNPDIQHIWTGDIKPALVKIDGVEIIENLMETAFTEYGESAGYWLDDALDMQVQELEDRINETLQKWLDKNNLQPKFGYIVNKKKVEV